MDVATLAKDAMAAGVENNWHNDVTWHTNPSFTSILRAVEIPEVGGQRIDPLIAEHDWMPTFGAGMGEEVATTLRPHSRRSPTR